jgi:hypothetical protein
MAGADVVQRNRPLPVPLDVRYLKPFEQRRQLVSANRHVLCNSGFGFIVRKIRS